MFKRDMQQNTPVTAEPEVELLSISKDQKDNKDDPDSKKNFQSEPQFCPISPLSLRRMMFQPWRLLNLIRGIYLRCILPK